MWSYFRFRFRRASRRLRHNLHIWRLWLGNYLDRHVYGAWRKLGVMRWLFLAWVGVIVIAFWGIFVGTGELSAHYLTKVARSGGTYREGVIGEIQGVNPILPKSSASTDLNRLIFSGLTRVGPNRQIEPDLAARWEISSDAKTYTFYLKPNLKWHDGKPVSAADIAFTIGLIQDPDTRSPLAANWQGVKVEVVNDSTLRLVLPKTFTPFLASTTVGILPKHILKSIKASNLAIDEFNLRPIGTGPFKTKYIDTNAEYLELDANHKYTHGAPMLDKIRLVRYENPTDMVAGVAKRQIDGMGTLAIDSAKELRNFPSFKVESYRMPAYVGVFFNLKNSTLADLRVRQGLAYATDRNKLVQEVLAGEASVNQFPIPPGYPGFNPSATHYLFSRASATHALSQNPTFAADKKLKFNLVTINSAELVAVANELKSNWAKLGVQINVVAVDAKSLHQNYIRPRNYDILLYGENLGVDSDVYSFWHSSQIDDPGLNITSYKSAEADKFLESGRIAKDPTNRHNKFAAFVNTWSRDLPAIILYSPHYIYARTNQLIDDQSTKITEPADRWYGVEKWAIKSSTIPTKSNQNQINK